MTAVILAAGVSSRLRPLTETIPKALLPVGGVPLVQRALHALDAAGIPRAVIVTGYLREKLEEFIISLKVRSEVSFVFNSRFAATNNNYSLWLARAAVRGDDLLLLDSDILFRPDVLGRLLSSPHANALVLRRCAMPGWEEMKITTDGEGRVLRLGKDIEPARAAGESLGIARFCAGTAEKLFHTLDRRRHQNEFYEASFQELIDQGERLFAVPVEAGSCMEIDTPADLAAAEELVQRT